jgi:DNA polymerase elongation subunit (family B)
MIFYTHAFVRGEKILCRGYKSNNGSFVRSTIVENYNPYLYWPSDKKTNWKTLEGKYVDRIDFGSIRECREFVKQYEDVNGVEIYGNTDFTYTFIHDQFPGEIQYNPSALKVCYLDIEVECEDGFPTIEKCDQRVNVITMRFVQGDREKTYTLCLGNAKKMTEDHTVIDYEEEDELLQAFVALWRNEDCDIVTGWNIQFYDIPYLLARIEKVLGEGESKKLSPWETLKTRIVTAMQKEHTVYDIVGIATMDYFDLYRKFTFVTRESYKLDHIASVELGENKISYDDYSNIQEFYKKDFAKFVEYNYIDVELVVKLEKKLRLLELGIALAYNAKVNFNDVFSQVRTWDAIIYHYLSDRNIVIPQKNAEEKEEQFAGGYVKDPQTGMHKWIVSFDLDSLYPHLIMQYNISPETKHKNPAYSRGSVSPDSILRMVNGESTKTFVDPHDYLSTAKTDDLSIAANGVAFRKDKKGFLASLMESMYEERKHYKKLMLECKRTLKEKKDALTKQEVEQLNNDISKYHNFQLVRKIQLNSAFGAVGNQYFRYYDLDLAEAITISGQLSIRWIEKHLNDFLNKTCQTTDQDYIIASDTDSVYICLDKLVDKIYPAGVQPEEYQKVVKFLDKACKSSLTPFIQKKYEELAVMMNAYQQKMNMKRESISNKGIWTAKKRYMLNVFMGEDDVLLDKPELKIMGIETTRSSTPQIVRDGLKKAIDILMNADEDNLISFVEKFRDEFNKLPAEKIAFPRSCRGMLEYADPNTIYRKSTPIHVKGSLLYNHAIKQKKLQKKYPLIKDGEKIKFVYLKVPNTIGDRVVSFLGSIPKELDLERFIDYNMQFEKSFLEPLTTITNVIGWNHEKSNTLESLFG